MLLIVFSCLRIKDITARYLGTYGVLDILRLCSQVKIVRARDRELYHSLKYRKLRRQHKKKLQQSVPVSSVLYGIAGNCKYWNMTYV